MLRKPTATLLALVVTAGLLAGAEPASGLKKGTLELKSAGALAFGPDGILFIGDSKSGAIFALDTGDKPEKPASGALKVEKISESIAGLMGTTEDKILINGMAVNPASGNVYLSVSNGKGPDAPSAIVRVEREGKPKVLPLENVMFAKATLPNAGKSQDAITHLAFVKNRVYVAGQSTEEFSSTLRALPFPFAEADKGTSVEIYHGAHGKLETKSPVRTFVPFDIAGEAHLLAAYQCTPLVKIPVADLKPGTHVKGTTIAELGNGNRPLDMIVYAKDGKNYILLANSKRGVMKITTDGIDKVEAITSRIGGTAGLKYDTIKDLEGVEHLDRLDKDNAVLLIRAKSGALSLETVPLP